MKFCKLFETAECGQILVKLDHNDVIEPEVRFYVQPNGLGVCSAALTFPATEHGWDEAEEAFTKVDLQVALNQVKAVIEMAEMSRDNG